MTKIEDRGFAIVPLLLAIAALAVLAVGGALILPKLQGEKLEGGVPALGTRESGTAPKAQSVKIVEGKVVVVLADGSEQVAADPINFTNDGVQEFIKAKLSPDGYRICFLGQTVTPIWLYVSESNGEGARKVTIAKNCVWSHDSLQVAFNNHTTDVSPVDINRYHYRTGVLTNFTRSKSTEEVIRIYKKPKWSDDGKYLTAEFISFSFADFENQTQGNSRVKVQTGEVADY